MGSASSPWAFTADLVPQAPEDPLFGLMAAYRKDTSPKKVDLGIGAYRDNNAKPWVLPVVKKVSLALLGLDRLRHMLTTSYRQMRSCEKIQTSTMNTYPSPAW
jgi:aspartate aminotransferase